jgi:hypothetical protein
MNKEKSHLLIDEPPLQVQPSLAVKVGYNEATVLQQVHYWIRHYRVTEEKRPVEKRFHYRPDSDQKYHWWVYNSIADWQDTNFPFWSEATIRRAFKELIKKGLVISEQLSEDKHDRTNWYTIDYEKLNQLEIDITTDTTPPAPEEHLEETPDEPTSEQMHVGNMTQWKESECQDGLAQDDRMIKGIKTETTQREEEEVNDGCAIGSAAQDFLVIDPDLAEAVSVLESTGRQLDSDTLARLEFMATACAQTAQATGETGGQWLAFALKLALGRARPESVLNYADKVLGGWLERGYRQRRRSSSRDEKLSPELVVFRQATGRLPLPDQRDLVVSLIHQRQFTSDDLRPYWEAWVGRDKRRSDLTWLTDWAMNGVIPQHHRNQTTRGKQRSAVEDYLHNQTKGKA